jgi:histidinol phosphatase-like PHP family hydrolase
MVNDGKHYRELARAYFGGLAHVHTKLSNYTGHYESNQTIDSYIKVLNIAGLTGRPDSPIAYIVITEHASNPTHPRKLGNHSFRARALHRQKWRTTASGMQIFYGFEASLLPGGGTDLTPQLARDGEIIIASRHWLPDEMSRNPEEIQKLLIEACEDDSIDVLGHPARGIESLRGIDWAAIFDAAARTGTAIEVNYNNFPDPQAEPARERFWFDWIKLLGTSDALTFLGTDLHNDYQLRLFFKDWRDIDRLGAECILGSCVEALHNSNIPPQRVVTSSVQRLQSWMNIDKKARVQVSLRQKQQSS